ncbi:MAG: T9SS type A sorting domain-containing protein, partial [Chitinophagaceae bacterium]
TNACMLMPTKTNVAGFETSYSIQPVARALSYNWTVPAGATITGHPAGTGLNDTIITVTYNSTFAGGAIQVSANGTCGTGGVRLLNISAGLNPGTPGAITVSQVQACPDRVYRYTVNAVNASYFTWGVPPGGTVISGQGTASIDVMYHQAPVNGFVSVTPGNGCAVGRTRFLRVDLLNCTPPLPFSFNNDGGNKLLEASVFPNPTTGAFNLKTNGESNSTLRVSLFDAAGRSLWQKTVFSSEILFLDESLTEGVYFLHVEQDKMKKVIRLVKR